MFDGLPGDWETTTLGAIATLGGGTTPSKGDEGYWKNGTVPWATPTDITSLPTGCDRISKTEVEVSERALAECSLTLNPPGTVLMTSRATIGYAAINDVPMTTNQGFINFRCGERADPQFLLHWLTAKREFLVAAAGGSTFKELSRGTAKLLPILLPPLDEQRRIAEVLRSVDEVIQHNRNAEQQAYRVLVHSLTDALRLNEDGDEALRPGWRVARIGDLGKVQAGRQRAPSFTNGHSRPYLRVANVFDGYIDTSNVLEMMFTDREYAEYKLLPGDILLNEGQSVELVGRAAMYRGEPENCCFQNTLVRLRAITVSSDFAYALVRTLYWSGRLSEIATQTTSVAHLGVSRFANLKFLLPPRKEQQRIGEIFHDLCSAVDACRAEGRMLVSIKGMVNSDLLSGRVRVPA